MQWKRIAVIVLGVILVAGPAAAIPVTDPAALAQRVTMMANQVSIIANQLTQIQQFYRQAHRNEGPGAAPEGQGPGRLPFPHFALHQS